MPATTTAGPLVTRAQSPDGDRSGGPATAGDRVRLTAWVHGRVQGVGFRWWARARATELGLVGRATNLPDGRVEVLVEGSERSCRAMLASLRGLGTPGRVRTVVEQWSEARGDFTSFAER